MNDIARIIKDMIPRFKKKVFYPTIYPEEIKISKYEITDEQIGIFNVTIKDNVCDKLYTIRLSTRNFIQTKHTLFQFGIQHVHLWTEFYDEYFMFLLIYNPNFPEVREPNYFDHIMKIDVSIFDLDDILNRQNDQTD